MTETTPIAITCADNSVVIMYFVTSVQEANDENIENEIARASHTFSPEKLPVQSWRHISVEDIPTDRTYRNALEDSGEELVFNIEKAKEIHRDLLRAERLPILERLDVEYLRADGMDRQALRSVIEGKKQKLRDITQDPRFESAQTLEDLKLITLPSVDD